MPYMLHSPDKRGTAFCLVSQCHCTLVSGFMFESRIRATWPVRKSGRPLFGVSLKRKISENKNPERHLNILYRNITSFCVTAIVSRSALDSDVQSMMGFCYVSSGKQMLAIISDCQTVIREICQGLCRNEHCKSYYQFVNSV
jgi:hypothetical protein